MNKRITFLVSLLFLILLFSFSSASAYTDVSSSHWAYDAINNLSAMGVLNGYTDGSFKPNQEITRAEFCKIMAEILGDKVSTQKGVSFQDVTRFHWANEYINKISGYFNSGKNRFYPDSYLIRQDAAMAMVNIAGYDTSAYDEKILHGFSDEKSISEEFEKYVALAVEHGIMKGNADGTFNPQGSVTRAEMCQIIFNMGLKPQNDNTNVSSSNLINGNGLVKDENGVIYVTTTNKTYDAPDIWLNITIEGGNIQDGGIYAMGKEEYIIATIGNPSSEKNFIYYSFASGSNYQNIVVQKVEDSRAEITIPEELIGKNIKLSIWGTSTKNGQGYMTETKIFMLKYTGDLSHRGESYSESYSVKMENRKADFILLLNGKTIEPETTTEAVKPGQKVIIRSKPVYNIQSINYRWDKDIEYTVVNHATETIEIPDSFTPGTTHKLTVRIVDKDGTVYMPRVFRFTMEERK